MDAFGKAVKKAMIDREISQIHYAEALGITPNYLSLITNGHRSPSWRIVKRIAKDFDISLDAIIRSLDNT